MRRKRWKEESISVIKSIEVFTFLLLIALVLLILCT